MAPIGKPKRRVVVEPLRETRPAAPEPRERPLKEPAREKPRRREKAPA